MEFLARFDFDITYVKGETNLVADALSRYSAGQANSTNMLVPELDFLGGNGPWNHAQGG
jgi:hypothetical protein